MIYRPEIDGLRAIAVVPVILFHAGFEIFKGGYVGVDVFFVISGYLITTILIEDLEGRRFNITRFYERRARRILPALFFVMFCCIPFSWAWMLPREFGEFSKSLIAVSLFVSNVLFWRESGYFDTAAEEKPLLHTWSLAVEEQYYILFPVFLFLMWRFGRTRVFWTIVICAAISLALSEWGWRNKPTANFYLAPTRAWELLAGSIASFIVHKKGVRDNNILSILGLAAIAFAIFAYDESTPFPSVYALAPVSGVVLIVLFAGKNTVAAKLLSSRLLVGIGLISYSAYLWHQPLFAFARIRLLEEPGWTLMLALSVASLVMAWFSWRYIEQPFRGARPIFSRRMALFSFSGIGLSLFILFGVAGYLNHGFESRFSTEVVSAAAASSDRGNFTKCLTGELRGSFGDDECALGRRDKAAMDFILVGDSFSSAIAGAVHKAAEQRGARGAILATNSCPALLGIGGFWQVTAEKCERLQGTMVQVVKESGAKRVLLASAWLRLEIDRICDLSNFDCDAEGSKFKKIRLAEIVRRTILAFEDNGIDVFFVGHPPRPQYAVPAVLAHRMLYDSIGEMSVPRTSSYPGELKDVLDSLNLKFTYVDISNYFCEVDRCLIARGGVPLFSDNGHITGTTSKELYRYFLTAMSF